MGAITGIETHLLLFFLGLLFSFFFGGMEIIFITANKLKIELDRKQGVFASAITSRFNQHPKLFVASMLIGQHIAFLLYVFSFWQTIMLLQHTYGYSLSWWVFIALFIVFAWVFLCFSEFIPKSLFAYNPNRWLSILTIPTAIFYYAFYPIAWLIVAISSASGRLFRGQPIEKEKTSDLGRIALNEYIEQATGHRDLSKDFDHEIQIFRNALDFSNVKARDCLVPRNEIVAVEITDSIAELQTLFIETRLSKIMVYRESIDHIIGYVHSFELFKQPEHIQHVLLPVSFISEPTPAIDILELFIKQKRNVVVVVDEFGGTAGIITMEDIVEKIFGNIEDEHDKPDTTEVVLNENTYELSARLKIDYLNEKYNLQLPENNEKYDTLGGLILFLAGDIPDENIRLETPHATIIPLIVNEKMVEWVRIETHQ